MFQTGGLHPPETPRTLGTREQVAQGGCGEDGPAVDRVARVGRAYGSGALVAPPGGKKKRKFLGGKPPRPPLQRDSAVLPTGGLVVRQAS